MNKKTIEQKLEAVRRYKSGENIAKIAFESEICVASIYNWSRELNKLINASTTSTTDLVHENKLLKEILGLVLTNTPWENNYNNDLKNK